jgi:hypothetical protein
MGVGCCQGGNAGPQAGELNARSVARAHTEYIGNLMASDVGWGTMPLHSRAGLKILNNSYTSCKRMDDVLFCFR